MIVISNGELFVGRGAWADRDRWEVLKSFNGSMSYSSGGVKYITNRNISTLENSTVHTIFPSQYSSLRKTSLSYLILKKNENNGMMYDKVVHKEYHFLTSKLIYTDDILKCLE